MKVVVVEDHPVFLDGLVSLLRSAGIEVTGTATSVRATLDLLGGDIDADLVIVDMALPDGDGAELTSEILRRRSEVRVLVVTMFHDDAVVARALDAGASGYLVKDAAPDEIVAAARAVANGSLVVGAAVADRFVGRAAAGLRHRSEVDTADFPGLRRRERQVLSLVAAGLDNSAIAERLGLSSKTVANYVSTILTQLQVPTRSAAIDLVRHRNPSAQ